MRSPARTPRTLAEVRELMGDEPAPSALAVPAKSALESSLRKHIDDVYEGCEKYPEMWGTPAEIEAIWRQTMLVEALLLYPGRSPHDSITAAGDAARRVLSAHGWPSSFAFHGHVQERRALLVVLKEWRQAYCEILRGPEKVDMAAMKAALQNRFFTFLRECGRLLGKNDEETSKLVDDPSWFACFDDGLAPADAVREYKAHLESEGTIKAWDDFHRDHASGWDGIVDVEKALGRDEP